MSEQYQPSKEQKAASDSENKAEEIEAKEPIRRATFELHGARIEFFGVPHTMPFLTQHRETLENAIKNASVVFWEGAPHTEGVFSDEMIHLRRSFFS